MMIWHDVQIAQHAMWFFLLPYAHGAWWCMPGTDPRSLMGRFTLVGVHLYRRRFACMVQMLWTKSLGYLVMVSLSISPRTNGWLIFPYASGWLLSALRLETHCKWGTISNQRDDPIKEKVNFFSTCSTWIFQKYKKWWKNCKSMAYIFLSFID